MSKEKETKVTAEEKALSPQTRLSPTSINLFNKCPRGYFYQYIAKLPVIPNIHLVKGSMVHEVLENFFRAYPKGSNVDLHKVIMALFESTWTKYAKQIKSLELPAGKVLSEKQDCINILDEYIISLLRKIKMLIASGKAENQRHAYYLLKPQFRELFVEDKDLHCCGYIDRVHKGFDGLITLADYKTSSKYGIGLPVDYKRQLAIYSILYKLQEKILPDFVAVDFLRYGESYFLEVTPSLLKYARDTITDVWAKTRSSAIGDYPLKESNLCRWCQFQNICNGEEDWQTLMRKAKFRKIAKENEKKKD